ncbi:hypothetical protein SAMN04487843_105116 [Methylobacterium sp. ap11]|uniref:hypothetical protein n=1 Tax=Methylobacterium sp. ap11 TaxID=1761799 RepID=UPI0008B89BE2|nr:hypothetical protein [Methylobacterium sp. ap11]SEO94175.1 hypothetical protein SAMN04487843_105116 [Methylobacterium sp. ap11]
MATATYDRPSIFRDAWARARRAAAQAAESVRRHIGAGMRAAWAAAKAALGAPAKPAAPAAPVPLQLDLVEYIAALPPVPVAPVAPAAPASPRRFEHDGYTLLFTPVTADGDSDVTILRQAADGSEHIVGAVRLKPAEYRDFADILQDSLSVLEVPEPEQQPEPAQEPLHLDLGRGRAVLDDAGIRFYGQVTGGGAHGPGVVSVATGFKASDRLRWTDDRRSGSGRSGSVVWTLKPDRLYSLSRVAAGSNRSADYYLSTFDGTLTELSRDEYRAECARLWPLQAFEAEQEEAHRAEAEAARVEAERREVERLKAEAEARKAALADEAVRIEREGQPTVEGLPSLTGSPKQVAYALKIRAAVQAKTPSDRALKTATTASYWIDNRRSVLWA